ncbi:MAG: hypothetical protein ACOYOK_05075 [Pseudobdellovibrionaceae bacterium]
MKIYFHKYELQPLQKLNAFTQTYSENLHASLGTDVDSFTDAAASPRKPTARHGALLKFVFESDLIGYADLHPWPELGDLNLSQHLQKLKLGEFTDRSLCSKNFARMDAEARKNKKSLFSSNTNIHNNFLISDLESASKVKDSFKQKSTLSDHQTVKIKISSQTKIETLLSYLNQVVLLKDMKVRLDANESFSEEGFNFFLSHLSNEHLSVVEYIEDPFPFEVEAWQRYNQKVSLAADKNLPLLLQNIENKTSFNYAIIKPAQMDFFSTLAAVKDWGLIPTVTSSMDHPVGVSYALLCAGLCNENSAQIKVHGCWTHHLYEQDAFSQKLNLSFDQKGVFQNSTSGFGIGFDDLLQQLSWKEL